MNALASSHMMMASRCHRRHRHSRRHHTIATGAERCQVIGAPGGSHVRDGGIDVSVNVGVVPPPLCGRMQHDVVIGGGGMTCRRRRRLGLRRRRRHRHRQPHCPSLVQRSPSHR